MYKIEKHDDYLLVKLEEDFDFNALHAIIHHIMSVKEYPDTNDIWLIGKNRADIRLGEIEALVHDFQCHCPRDAERAKTAIVVEPGLTKSIIELLASAASKRVAFEIRIFQSLADAHEWLGAEVEPQVA